jgi:hypothetical protein
MHVTVVLTYMAYSRNKSHRSLGCAISSNLICSCSARPFISSLRADSFCRWCSQRFKSEPPIDCPTYREIEIGPFSSYLFLALSLPSAQSIVWEREKKKKNNKKNRRVIQAMVRKESHFGWRYTKRPGHCLVLLRRHWFVLSEFNP